MKGLMNRLSRPFGDAKDKQKGMSLIEIIIVISLMGVLMTIIITNVVQQGDESMKDAARIAMGQLEQKLQMYRVHNFRYPNNEEGLQALVTKPSTAKKWRGPYIKEEKLSDPWGNEYTYESDGKDFRIVSPGANGVVGDEDDISYPEEAGGDEGGEE